MFVVGAIGAYEIREIGADGNGEHLVRALPSSFSYGAGWSPRGTAIAFVDGQDQVFVMRLNDGRTKLVAPDAAPGSSAWSPDGRKVSYIARRPGLQIFTVNADGTGRRKITGGHARAIAGIRPGASPHSSPDRRVVVYVDYHDLAWSPNKRGLAYLRRVSSPDSAKIAVGGYQDSGVMTVGTRANTKKAVTDCCVGVHDPAWSRDGKKLVLFSDSSAGPGGAIVNADGSHLRILHINGHDPAWSPDSTRITFADGSGHVRIVTANGIGLRRLTDASGVIGPTWK